MASWKRSQCCHASDGWNGLSGPRRAPSSRFENCRSRSSEASVDIVSGGASRCSCRDTRSGPSDPCSAAALPRDPRDLPSPRSPSPVRAVAGLLVCLLVHECCLPTEASPAREWRVRPCPGQGSSVGDGHQARRWESAELPSRGRCPHPETKHLRQAPSGRCGRRSCLGTLSFSAHCPCVPRQRPRALPDREETICQIPHGSPKGRL